MATIEDYVSGRVCRQLEKAFAIFAAAGAASLKGSDIGGLLLKPGPLSPKPPHRQQGLREVRRDLPDMGQKVPLLEHGEASLEMHSALR